jgi:hypothetical protein
MVHARAASVAFLTFVALAGCSKREDAPAATPAPPSAPAAAPTAAAAAPAAAAATPAASAPAPPRPPPVATIHLQLRSTPPGADVAVDGRPVGRTPAMTDVPVDDREHEVTFVLPGYALERYRTRAVQNGVIHATMHAIPAPAAPPRK